MKREALQQGKRMGFNMKEPKKEKEGITTSERKNRIKSSMISQENRLEERMKWHALKKWGGQRPKRGCSWGEVGAKESSTINPTKKKYEYGAEVKTGARTGTLSEGCGDGDARFKILV